MWDATGPAKCKCGTYAIGECAECGVSVCGDHSAVHEGRRLCIELANPLVTKAALERQRQWLESVQLNRPPVPLPVPPPPATVTDTARAIDATLAALSARGNPGIQAFFVRRKAGSRLRQVWCRLDSDERPREQATRRLCTEPDSSAHRRQLVVQC